MLFRIITFLWPYFLLTLEGDIRYCILRLKEAGRRFHGDVCVFGCSGLVEGKPEAIGQHLPTLLALLYTLRFASSLVYQLPTQHASLFLTVHVFERWRWCS